MSEFSQKLMDCIEASGYSIYQLAKEASLDRTTLQKTAKGQRLPSLDYIKDICRYMKISQKQEEELYRLYQIEKLGKDTVASWDEIHQIIVDIGEIRQKTKSNLNIHFEQQNFHHFNEDIIYLASRTGTIIKGFAYNLQPYALEFLNKNLEEGNIRVENNQLVYELK